MHTALMDLAEDEQMILLNACLAAANERFLDDAKTVLQEKLDSGRWFVYKGGHHIAIGLKGKEEEDPCLKLFDPSDPYLSMLGFPEYLCKERLALGLNLIGTGH
jgi:hypothetical protein